MFKYILLALLLCSCCDAPKEIASKVAFVSDVGGCKMYAVTRCWEGKDASDPVCSDYPIYSTICSNGQASTQWSERRGKITVQQYQDTSVK